MLLPLKADDFIHQNTTYVSDILERLGVSGDDVFPIVSCRSCGFYYAGNLLSERQMSILYNDCIDKKISLARVARDKKIMHNKKVWKRMRRLADSDGLSFGNHLKLLEFGCGWSDFLKEAKCAEVSVFGVETDEHKLRHAGENGIAVVENMDDLKSEAPFDLFYCNTVLEHMSDPLKLMRDVNRMLAPGAIGFIGIPDYGPRRMRKEMKAYNSGGKVHKNVNPWEHVNYFSRTTLKKLLKETGFRQLRNTFDSKSVKIYHENANPIVKNCKEFMKGVVSIIFGTTSRYIKKVKNI